jgi:photosystem II stability/assembly factor-like uncharacterized protein
MCYRFAYFSIRITTDLQKDISMYRPSPTICLTLLSALLTATAHAQPSKPQIVWTNVTRHLTERTLYTIAVHPEHAAQVLVGSAHTLYHTTDGGRTWSPRLRLREDHAQIYALHVHPHHTALMYAATSAGLYRSNTGGLSWTRITRTPCYALLMPTMPNGVLWLGAADGLWYSVTHGQHWEQAQWPSRHAVYALTAHPAIHATLYASTAHAVWQSQDHGKQWSVLLITDATGGTTSPVQDAANDPMAARDTRGHPIIAADTRDVGHIFVASSAGVLTSRNSGASWERVPTTGFLTDAIHDILLTQSPTRMYAATAYGAYALDTSGQHWAPLTRGLTARHVYQLVAHPLDHTLWAVTDRGVFHGLLLDAAQHAIDPRQVHMLFTYEPSINEVQRMATTYAELSPAKITHWRRQAARQALLPTIRIGTDRDIDIDDRVDEGSFPYFQQIPQRSVSRGWDVSVSWDLGNLLWNDDQLAIDVRSKLTTDVRNDVLDAVTRLYYERRRLQVTQLIDPPDASVPLLEHDLRIQELTAHLNALTGGAFTQALERVH